MQYIKYNSQSDSVKKQVKLICPVFSVSQSYLFVFIMANANV